MGPDSDAGEAAHSDREASDPDRGASRSDRDASHSGRAASRSDRVAPTQPTLRRMREFEIRPDRELGQNFLIDSNILGVIGGLAELAPGDVVLEVGGGLGVLSEYLAERVGHVHVVELDTRLAAALEDAVGRAQNVTLHWGDVLRVDLAAMRPRPDRVVANLPYGVAAGALLRTIEELPGVGRWVAMVQREVGERLAAAPGTRVYGVPSVLAQLACDVRVARAVPRTVFYPVPNVDSVLVAMERTASAPSAALRALVGDAFAHRRKTLARSLALAAPLGGDYSYDGDAVRAALVQLGHPADARAERLSPGDFRALWNLLSSHAA
jgi:16S rRNA (adenine1518-N6/adenine1519-N6)-dimethyltransferase